MNRRVFLFSLTATLMGSSAAFASDFSEDVVQQLHRNGYVVVSVTRTFLGRTRIRATKAGGEREIILNGATGEILRDVWVTARKDGNKDLLEDDGGSSDSGDHSGSGRSDDTSRSNDAGTGSDDDSKDDGRDTSGPGGGDDKGGDGRD